MAHPLAEKLASGFISHFWSADTEITWTAAEVEKQVWLAPNTLLVGRVDAEGINAEGQPFFAEWKTMGSFKARRIELVKMEWRMSPQSLTYGVLVPNMHTFTVRWAIKPFKADGPCTYDFEWYTYTDAEVEWWRGELLRIADHIRQNRVDPRANWPVNPTACLKYGERYACAFYHEGCSKLRFDFVPEGMLTRTPHLEVERALPSPRPDDLVVLDATRIEVWMECEEKYRRYYEGAGGSEEGEALVIGGDFHAIIRDNVKRRMNSQ